MCTMIDLIMIVGFLIFIVLLGISFALPSYPSKKKKEESIVWKVWKAISGRLQ